ncbi:MAG: quinohemoprotein amine dehydrogenase subunit alpha [Gemmatimonadota bacterium]|nr:quinohemoprotein amine dehydrogenase subunit alpha [Gemmatimonadota bacterium]
MSSIGFLQPPGSMASPARFPLTIAATAALGVLLAWSPHPTASGPDPVDSTNGSQIPGHLSVPVDGYPVTNQTLIDRCSRCHTVDEEGRMSRISFLRKTPEGWQTSIRRMLALHGARLSQEDAREIVRYLANEQGLAPEELRPGLFEVERRSDDFDWEGDSDVEYTCIQCHSMGRVMTQRRTQEEWGLLLATHRSLYPLVDFQAFRYSGPASEQDDSRHPMDRAISYLAEVFPLETPEWSAWATTKRAPRLGGVWALSGYEPGKGAIYGSVTITANPGDPEAFTTSTAFVYAETGERVERTGQTTVYTGYQWRGRSNPGSDDELREVMFIERDQRSMSGRWFGGDYDEFGPDVSMQRASGAAIVTGVHPMALRRGQSTDVRVYGVGLSASDELDFGNGVTVESVNESDDGSLRVRLGVGAQAGVGARDLFAAGSLTPTAIVVHDGVDRIEVTPLTGMARTGGAAMPKGYETFDAIGWDNGPDGSPNTDDDLELGRVSVTWGVEEYAATYGDDDIDFVGSIRQDGVFDPALDGPNPARRGNANNIGDVWVVATYQREEGRPLSARAHLVVAPPLYMRWEPWREIDTGRRPVGDER